MTFRETDEDLCSTVAPAPEVMRFRFGQGLRYDGGYPMQPLQGRVRKAQICQRPVWVGMWGLIGSLHGTLSWSWGGVGLVLGRWVLASSWKNLGNLAFVWSVVVECRSWHTVWVLGAGFEQGQGLVSRALRLEFLMCKGLSWLGVWCCVLGVGWGAGSGVRGVPV